jgi:ElaB/YqjD/DUF883 family membrane-anchored ribosome-binding protein
MEGPREGYGLGMRLRAVVPFVLIVLLACCSSESGLRDELRQATEAIDSLVDEIGDSGPIREAADEAKGAVEESRAALESFRDDPSAETRQALEEAARHLQDARELVDGALEDAPEAVRASLDGVVDALENLREQIQRELED